MSMGSSASLYSLAQETLVARNELKWQGKSWFGILFKSHGKTIALDLNIFPCPQATIKLWYPNVVQMRVLVLGIKAVSLLQEHERFLL